MEPTDGVSVTDVKIRLERLATLLDGFETLNRGNKQIHIAKSSPRPDSARKKNPEQLLSEWKKPYTPRATPVTRVTSGGDAGRMRPVIGGTPISYDTAKDLRVVLTGSALHRLSAGWQRASFVFQSLNGEFPYGLLAHANGSRGLLMSVQAYILKHLIFKYTSKEQIFSNNVLRPTMYERRDALISALSELLWQAGSHESCVVCLPQQNAYFGKTSEYFPDGFTEKLHLFEFRDENHLHFFIKQFLSYFEYESTSGCLLFLYSIILSRTVPSIYGDSGGSGCQLLTDMEEMTRSLMTLVLTGRAVSHLHNGTILFDNEGEPLEEPLVGIAGRNTVGHLYWHRDEANNKRTEVGSMLRTPCKPIWLTQINGHNYGVLFGINPELVGNWRAEHRFVLHYYTGLATQRESAKLSIDTRYGRKINGRTSALRRKEEAKIPSLERCIMSKYPGAEVDWNDVHPFV